MMEVVLSDSDASSSEQTEGLTSSGAGTEHVDVVGLSATRSVSGGNLFGSSVGVHALPLDGLALTLVSRLNAVPKQEPRERRAADTILGGEDVDRLPGEVVLDEVVSVRWRPFVGHVFNLQTTSGLYIASGVFVANCRCTMALTFKVSE